jgi:hypothetical protein
MRIGRDVDGETALAAIQRHALIVGPQSPIAALAVARARSQERRSPAVIGRAM